MSILTIQLEEGRKVSQASKQYIKDAMMIHKEITVLNITSVLPIENK